MKQHLSIDLETYSSVQISKSGLYKYIQSPDFEILLLAYSLNNGKVEIIDLAQGEHIPNWLNDAIKSADYIKHAYNAAFEWYALSKHYGYQLPIDQWRDTMLHGLYCGMPAGLDATGKALGLSPEKQKLLSGKALIRYFCMPCSATKANKGRTRNLPKHDQAKWELFKKYCKGDVIAEMEIENKLSTFPVPEHIEKQWQIDLGINTRGVAVDMDIVRGALEIGTDFKNQLLAEAVSITGLENPNSIAQLTKWLEENTDTPITDLRKDTVSIMLENQTVYGPVERMLKIRQELGKTSIKKYDAIEAAVCDDGRVRGLLQFYGANRTGRWAGRLVQVQNLPRTYISQLEFARKSIKERKKENLKHMYGSISDTLSQLIRTSFIATENNRLVDVDFSAIEARVIAWLAEEQWRLEVFKTHGKIYEASASQMFGVPIEKIKKGNPEYELRQKGKVAELALGYQGSTGALISMGALKMGILEEDLPDIVTRWRNANKRIVDLWYTLENAVIAVLQNGNSVGIKKLIISREYCHKNNLDFLTIALPSGRKLFYANPKINTNKWGRTSITYKGINQTTKQWTTLETYGGKLVENVIQAIARDCLSTAIERLESNGYSVVFHVHDEVVIDCTPENADVNKVAEIMTQPIPWAEDLPLAADGWVGDFFRKD